jgi:hypothetical protein
MSANEMSEILVLRGLGTWGDDRPVATDPAPFDLANGVRSVPLREAAVPTYREAIRRLQALGDVATDS